MRFDELGLDDSLMEGLEAMNFEETTPIQELAIPVILEGKDVVACAQTGTGKTAAYILPLLNRLIAEPVGEDAVQALIMAPTRELAQQIDTQFEGFGYFLNVSTAAVYGGGDGNTWDQQKRALLLGAEVCIATPGRLIAFLQTGDIDLSRVRFLVLDEADRMLDMGFHDDIMQIVGQLPKERQTLLFSATMPPKIRQLAEKVLRDPVEVSVAVSKPNEAIVQAAYVCTEMQKGGIIDELFSKPLRSKTIIFSSKKQKVKDLAFSLKRRGYNVGAMHSDLEQAEREKVMLDFKNDKIDILVATDIVARGIDIEEIGLVINYDVPGDPEDYIHRIGRTARASADGVALTFVSEVDQGKFHRIERFLGEEIYKIPLPASVGKGPEYHPESSERKGRGRKGKGRNHRGGGQRKKGNQGEKREGVV